MTRTSSCIGPMVLCLAYTIMYYIVATTHCSFSDRLLAGRKLYLVPEPQAMIFHPVRYLDLEVAAMLLLLLSLV